MYIFSGPWLIEIKKWEWEWTLNNKYNYLHNFLLDIYAGSMSAYTLLAHEHSNMYTFSPRCVESSHISHTAASDLILSTSRLLVRPRSI
jgi:hypothetical protein